MVSLINEKSQLDFLPADPFAARITALFETYGASQSFAFFWVQTIGGVPTAAVSRVDGSATLFCAENADYEELSSFLSAVGFSDITCHADCAERLGLPIKKTSFIVRYCGNEAELSAADILNDYDKKELYALLTECGFELGDYGSFLADVCARLAKGTASLAAVQSGGELSACAFALFEGEKSVLLGAVATRPSARGKGYASALVGSLANEKSEKAVFLFCRNDSLADFYNKIGFEICGRWAVC